MRTPLGELGRVYGIDILLPLVDRQQVIAVLGVGLGRRPSSFERRLLEHLRVEATAAAANVRLHREAAQKLTLEKEVDLAGAVQQALAPLLAEASHGPWAWVGHVRSAGQVGGDFWCSYQVEGGVLIVAGDVIGQGLGGSMVSAVAKSACDAFAAAGVTDPATLLAGVNRAMWRPGKQFNLTCIAAFFDSKSKEIAWASAGHPAPYLATLASDRPQALLGWGAMLGEAGDTQYVTQRRPLVAGDTVAFHTDGIPEAINADRVAFGERRLQRALMAARELEPARCRDQILYALEAWKGGVASLDDELLVIVRCTV
jgi:serine phosphatase RsbU (regulator of sigma subunit)